MGNSVPSNPIHEFTSLCLYGWVDAHLKLMYADWLYPPTVAEYREGAALFIGQLQEREIDYWIMDAHQLGDTPWAEQRRILHQVAPAVAASGLKKIARILPLLGLNQELFEETIQQLQNKYEAKVEVRQFDTFTEAVNWLAPSRAEE